MFVPQDENRIISGAPGQRAEQNRVEQADVIADQKIRLIPPQAIQTVDAAQVRQGKEAVRAQTEQRLDEHQPSRDAQMVRLDHDSTEWPASIIRLFALYFAARACLSKSASCCFSAKNAG